MQYLLAHDIPETIQIFALDLAAMHPNTKIFKLLIPGSDYSKVLHDIQHTNDECASYGQIDTIVLKQCIEQYECEQQRGRLEQAVATTTSSVRKI